MAVKSLVLCVSLLIVQISSQCIGNAYNPGLACPNAGLAYGGACANGLAGPSLGSCGSPIPATAGFPPTGMSIYSDNILIEGPVLVGGLLPFSATVALEGIMPSSGAGTVSYTCGTGAVGIVSELGGPVGPGPAGLGYGVPGVGCGCGALY